MKKVVVLRDALFLDEKYQKNSAMSFEIKLETLKLAVLHDRFWLFWCVTFHSLYIFKLCKNSWEDNDKNFREANNERISFYSVPMMLMRFYCFVDTQLNCANQVFVPFFHAFAIIFVISELNWTELQLYYCRLLNNSHGIFAKTSPDTYFSKLIYTKMSLFFPLVWIRTCSISKISEFC